MLSPVDLRQRTLRAIALYQGIKGLIALALGIGLLSLMQSDVFHFTATLIDHFGLNPLDRYPAMLLHNANRLHEIDSRTLSVLIISYISLRSAEGIGLWQDKVWAEWLGAVSGSVYIPFEIRHLISSPTALSLLILLGNLFVVLFLLWRLWQRRSELAAAQSDTAQTD